MPVFLFTDIEGHTQSMWEKHLNQIEPVLSRHDSILEENVVYHGGIVFKHSGDRIFAAFEGGYPMDCAIAIQKQFAAEDWGPIGQLHICIALHAGQAETNSTEYLGSAVERTSRVRDLAWGDQILMTSEVLEICTLPVGATVEDLGTHLLRDLDKPLHILGLLHPDLPTLEFAPLKSLSMPPETLPNALKTARDINVSSLTMYALVGLARTMEMQGEYPQAVELLALVLKHATSEMIRRKATGILLELRLEMSSDMFAIACRNGEVMDLEEVVNQLVEE